MEPPVDGVESELIDLAGVSVEALRSMDGALLETSLAKLLREVDRSEASAGGYNPNQAAHIP
ncbi:hypothetical protein [Streptomyces sp. MUM 178J]|uniref:hypothetical protein n=1 Tax=Streptomyces sp. MUM 178J TaxID=2791991 RepID=UPI001F04C62D|nr:hypothetical protein [Streptomyces sp. MUM 178J]WRQ78025.1 hypothetical protein I3F59_000720 [Streptomyces sp. MUM 178J]